MFKSNSIYYFIDDYCTINYCFSRFNDRSQSSPTFIDFIKCTILWKNGYDCVNEVDSGTIEASKAMGASNFQIITKVLIPEAKPALISSVTVMAISLVGYTAMAGAIGAGGLGNLAYLYGMARNNNYIMYTATILILIIVFIIQIIGDYFVRKLDKR